MLGGTSQSVSVTATSEGVSGTATISVEPVPVANVIVSPPLSTLPSGTTLQLTVRTLSAAGQELQGRSIRWSVSNATAAITAAGLLTAGKVLGATAQTVVAMASVGDLSGTSSITVEPVPVAAIELTVPRAGLPKADTLRLGAVVRGAVGEILTGRTLQWSVDDTSAGIVSATGLVTARRSSGTIAVRASSGSVVGSASLSLTCQYQLLIQGVSYVGAVDPTDCPSATSGLFFDSFRFSQASSSFASFTTTGLSSSARLLASMIQDSSFAHWNWDFPAGGGGESFFLYGAGSFTVALRSQVIGVPLSYQLRARWSSTRPPLGCTTLGLAIGTQLLVDQQLNECLQGEYRYHFHQTFLQAGQRITITQQSAAFDTYLCARRSDSTTWECNDDISDTDSNSQLIITAPSSGYYVISASSYERNGSGAYRMGITSTPVYGRNIVDAPSSHLPSPVLSGATIPRRVKGS